MLHLQSSELSGPKFHTSPSAAGSAPTSSNASATAASPCKHVTSSGVAPPGPGVFRGFACFSIPPAKDSTRARSVWSSAWCSRNAAACQANAASTTSAHAAASAARSAAAAALDMGLYLGNLYYMQRRIYRTSFYCLQIQRRKKNRCECLRYHQLTAPLQGIAVGYSFRCNLPPPCLIPCLTMRALQKAC